MSVPIPRRHPRHALLIAFHFPPFTASSGVQRALRVAQHLPEFGWDCTVLTVSARAHQLIDPNSNAQIPPGLRVLRVPCLDASRDLAIGGRVPITLCLPDRWSSWWITGGYAGTRFCRRHAVDMIWSTYPIATAHLVADTIARRTGIPWVADFRDPMAQGNYPEDPLRRRSFQRIESRVAARAARMVFTTESACELYRRRFPARASDSFQVIENGFDEHSFQSADPQAGTTSARTEADSTITLSETTDRRRVLLHSGVVYEQDRNPEHLFAALAQLLRHGQLSRHEWLIRFRASGLREELTRLAQHHGVHDMIELAPPLPYAEAIREMQSVDGLLLLQADTCNQQIPAKMYEYLRAGRPILALTDPRGETGRKLVSLGFPHVVPLEQAAAISQALMAFTTDLRAGRGHLACPSAVSLLSRRQGVCRLATLFDECLPASVQPLARTAGVQRPVDDPAIFPDISTGRGASR